eukprot:15019749-Heterocapsa_arctica.AAC.1
MPDGTVREWKMGRGTRQGDSTGSDAFGNVYNAALASYRAKCPDPDLSMSYEGLCIDAGIVAFVDDVADLVVESNAQDMHERAQHQTESLTRKLASVGASLEPAKEQVVMRWMGKGAMNQIRIAEGDGCIAEGDKVVCARLLGGWVSQNGSKQTEVRKRVTAMRG